MFISNGNENIQDSTGDVTMQYTRLNRVDATSEVITPYDQLHETTPTTTSNAGTSSTYQNVQDNSAFADDRGENLHDGYDGTTMQYTALNRQDAAVYEEINTYDQLHET